ncbi:M56 family metallopeptidase [Bacillus sp. REN16]|uniref:M56 family metallopeptidase n=1 Tax=Bacillus sp. REN16 TaxID=2887296 RepID=UPI001E57CA55|nr:M56 family metallopeptidase [Bacillus sp. REN16]MCC3355551.1 M56 family metallopeptidase [Bacillus sp. REN16]
MLPNWYEIGLYILVGLGIQLIGMIVEKVNKRLGSSIEIILALLAIGFVFYQVPFMDGFIYIAFISSGYFLAISLTTGYEKRIELQEELRQNKVEKISLGRDFKRIASDIFITGFVVIGAILFYIFGPEYSLLKYIIVFGLVSTGTEVIKRIGIYATVNVFYDKEEKQLYLVSYFESRKIPIEDLEDVKLETNVDLLKLHPLLTMFSSNADFTTSFRTVLRLYMPGETVYITIREAEKWKSIIDEKINVEEKVMELNEVLPFWHRKNIKRLIGKLYFASTVKGVSAYTGLLLLLYYFEVPSWIMVTVALAFWGFNLYISDQVLKVAMDAEETQNLELIQLSQRVFEKAGIPNVRVYETESTEYNGLATGMNIGKSMVTITTATLKLPVEAIEGILAHEAIHVKKRDVLWGQLWRFVYLILVFGIVLLIQKYITNIEEYKIPLFLTIWFLMIIFPIIQSFSSQWMEVRADHLGASLLSGGSKQMSSSLITLSEKQDEAINKSLSYSTVIKEEKDVAKSSIERDSLIWRFIEFQFMLHPPMYWRVQTLKENNEGWGKRIRNRWMVDRVKESILR